jgi:hypothetical protein
MVELTDSEAPNVAGVSQNPRCWLELGVLLTSVFVATLDNFIVFVAIPSIRYRSGCDLCTGRVHCRRLHANLRTWSHHQWSSRRQSRAASNVPDRLHILHHCIGTMRRGSHCIQPHRISYRQGIAIAMLSPQVLAIIRVTFVQPREHAAGRRA